MAAFSHLLSLEFIKHLKNYTDEELLNNSLQLPSLGYFAVGTALLANSTGTPYPSFNIEYPLKDQALNEGVYENWSMILIRDDRTA